MYYIMVSNRDENIVGRKYWKLTITSDWITIRKWNQWKRFVDVKCECWNEKKNMALWHIKNWEISSCWCWRFKKRIPKIWDRHWKLTILEISKKWMKVVRIRCDCWNEKNMLYNNILASKNASCWCMIWQYQEKHGSWYHAIYIAIKKNAARRKIPFTLDEELFVSMIKSNCFYCNSWPSNKNTRGKHKQIVTLYNWIDRVSSSEWYVEGNVVPCCKRCNYAKAEMSVDEFIKHINKIYQRIAKWDGKLPTQVLGWDMNLLMQMK